MPLVARSSDERASRLGRVSQSSGPGDDCVEDGGGAVDDRELVVAGGESAPLLEVAEAAFDHVPAAVVVGVEAWWPATSGAAPLPVPCLVGGLGDHGVDAGSVR